MTPAPFAQMLERRFAARPHVGVVTHFEGAGVPAVIARVRSVMEELGLRFHGAVEQVPERPAFGARPAARTLPSQPETAHVRQRPVFNALAYVPVGQGMELWLAASEQPALGCKLEMRLYHVVEESAEADEYLAAFAARLAATPQHRGVAPERNGYGDT